ncbi:MAG: hypothetical protein AB8G15_16795 [Saprospiraceae bacterium]
MNEFLRLGISFSLCFFVSTFSASATLIVANSKDTILQNYHRADQIKATKKAALIRVKLTDFRKKALGGIPIWAHNRQGQYWQGTTDAAGELFFLLPNNAKYVLNVDQEENYRKFSIPKKAKLSKTVKVVLMTTRIKEIDTNDTITQQLTAGMMPTSSRALVNIRIMDLEGRPLPNELVYYESQQSTKVYRTVTNAQGRSTLMIPKGDRYCIHTYAHQNITCKDYEDSPHSRMSRFELKMISTAEFKKRALERAALLAQRDERRRQQRIQDSLAVTRLQYQNFYLQHRYDKKAYATIEASIKELVQKDQEALQANQNYYTDAGEDIKSMFQRNKGRWTQKRIIANIDCSMYRYIDELMVWNYANEAERTNNRYWLFNGFNYEGGTTEGHQRRGIFAVPENTVTGFFNTIDKIVNFSCRGSRLENVVEALLLGAEGKTPEEDLLFIADNYSDVSDLHKLKELTVPVHVLLTDAEKGVNENYLEIAYHTGGSIHTRRTDISTQQLRTLTNGDQLKIGKFSYTFFHGKFLKRS